MSSLPEDLYLQILLRVPVKSTFVCKCVCKSWFSLISDPNFPKKHLDFTPHRNISSNLMVSGLDDTRSSIINSVSFDSLQQPSLPEKNQFVQMHYPHEFSGYKVEILGSCNGLVCLVFYYNGNIIHDGSDGELFFCIWNPATREYKRINIQSDRIDFHNICMCAFGYDHKNDDYKLVIGVDSDDGTSSSEVYVYTIQSDSWRSAIRVPYIFCSFRKPGVLTNGEFHSLAYKGQVKLIVSLDINEERFKEMQLPVGYRNGHCSITEAVLEGCLCVLTLFRDGRRNIDADDRRPPRVEVWVMQDYGVQKSWTKRYIITHEVITSKIVSEFYGTLALRFIWSSKNGEILLMMESKLIIYDPKDGSTVELDMGSVTRLSSAVSYFESLVSVNSGTYVAQGQIEESIEPEEA